MLTSAAARRGLPRALQQQRGAVRCLAFAPPHPPAASPMYMPNLNKTAEDKRKDYFTNAESKYKHGKHRCNGLELVMKVPPIEVDREYAICDGGGGALGHPVEYISLEVPGAVEECKYCSLRFTRKKKE